MTREERTGTSRSEWLVCPLCREALVETETRASCTRCGREFPLILGIPDFRSAAGADYRGAWKEEESVVASLVAAYGSCNVRGLIEVLLAGLSRRSESDRAHLRVYFLQGLEGRIQHRVALIDHLCRRIGKAPDFSRFLEIGCGTGTTLFELTANRPAVGIDPNLLHLIIAKRHAEDRNLPIRFACAFAEQLPFRTGSFTFVHFLHALEHFTDQPAGLSEVSRVLSPGGIACFDIPNRFSLWREPHTKIWGIGFLPLQWTALRRIHNQSLWGLTSLLRRAFGKRFRIETMLVRFEVPGYERTAIVRAIARELKRLQKLPGVRGLIAFFQPGFEVLAWKPD